MLKWTLSDSVQIIAEVLYESMASMTCLYSMHHV